MSVPIILSVVAGLLIVIGLIEPLAERLKLPASVLFAIVGILIGGGASFLLYTPYTDIFNSAARVLVYLPVNGETFLYVFLPVLLFQAALNLDVRRMLEDAAPIFLLAVIAVIAATGAIGFALGAVTHYPLVACLLLGAIVATTDPVAVLAIFRDLGAPARLTRLVEGESLLNDAAAITLFVLLLELLVGGTPITFSEAALRFAISAAGGGVLGYVIGRAGVALFLLVSEIPPAVVTLSVALPYVVYIVAEQVFHVSGVIAALSAGVAVNIHGQMRASPDAWRYMREIWEQLEFWASSLIFVMASILVPRLLDQLSIWDLVPLVVLILAAFLSRAAVLFGLLPLLTVARLSARVSARFKTVILWGGLRGAVTLALALVVTENYAIDPAVRRFVGVMATGFVLFTLLVNGTTLRLLIRLLGLDRLSPFDQLLRDNVLALALGNVRDVVDQTARDYGLADTSSEQTIAVYDARIATVAARTVTESEILDRDRIRLGLVALADRERTLVLEHFRERTISLRIIEKLLTDTGLMAESARVGGRVEYNRAARHALDFPRSFRVALFLHRAFSINNFLVNQIADRFERLLVMRIILSELVPFVQERVAPIVGDRVAALVEEILATRREGVSKALDALRLQYPDYADSLERSFLLRVALRREELEYRNLFDDRLIGNELYTNLRRSIDDTREKLSTRPVLDLGLRTRDLIATFPMFTGLSDAQLDQITRLLKPLFAVPGELLIRRGERGESVYFISSGAVEVARESGRVRLGRGDFVGELALLTGAPRAADVTALGYCQLLVLEGVDFRRLLDRNPEMKTEVERVAAERLAMNLGRTAMPPPAQVAAPVPPSAVEYAAAEAAPETAAAPAPEAGTPAAEPAPETGSVSEPAPGPDAGVAAVAPAVPDARAAS